MIRFSFLIVFSFYQFHAIEIENDSINKQRKQLIMISQSAVTVAGLVGLNQLWYKDFEKSSFHFKDDANHWLQMDKAGHIHSAYHLTRLSAELMSWSGENKKNQRLYGAIYSQAFLTTVEIFDGFSKAWGFSWSDVGANLFGTSLYISQDYWWNEQRITPKFSFYPSNYAQLRPDVLGNTFNEQLLKDYNGQIYWLSFNLNAFTKDSKIPKFINVALGYGAEGMTTATPLNNIQDQRFRKFYLSLDLDFQRIETKKKWLKALFSVFNVLKFPFPALEFSNENDVKGHLFK